MDRLRLSAVASLAWIGIALGHLVTCALVRHEHDPMFRSMHSWVPFAAVVAIAAVPAVLAIVGLHALRAERGSRPLSMGRMLAAIQIPLFLMLEILERVAAPGPFAIEPAVLLGVAIQLIVVLVSVLVLAAVAQVVRALAGPRPRARKTTRGVPPALAAHREPDHLVFLVRTRRRAPPLPLAA